MNGLKVKRLSHPDNELELEKVAESLNGLGKNQLLFVPWKTFPYKPGVSFVIFYTSSTILIKFFVEEKELRANTNKAQGAVSEYSCVEFFIGFDNDTDAYYNFEFNCLGTCDAAFGNSRNERQLLAPEIIQKLKTYSAIRKGGCSTDCWELSLSIPITAFVYLSVSDLQGVVCRSNFYKCGDLLNEPHFLSWSKY